MDVSQAPAGTPGASATAEGMPTAPSAPVKHKVKVYDKEYEVTEDDLKKDWELRQASHVRMQKAAETQNQFEKRMEGYKKDPWALFNELGLDPDQVAEERLLKKLELQMMTPEQKKLYEREQLLTNRERQIAALEEEKKKYAEDLAKQEQEQLTYKAIQEIDQEIGDVLKASGLTPTPRVISRIAEIMLSHLDSSDGERLSADKAYGLARNEMMTEMAEYLGALPPDQLAQVIPKKVLDSLRKSDLDKVRGTDPIKRGSSQNKFPSNQQARGKKTVNTDSFFKRLENKLSR